MLPVSSISHDPLAFREARPHNDPRSVERLSPHRTGLEALWLRMPPDHRLPISSAHHGIPGQHDAGLQVRRGFLATLAICFDLVGDLHPLSEAAHPGPLHSTHVHEDILAALVGLDEAVAFGLATWRLE